MKKIYFIPKSSEENNVAIIFSLVESIEKLWFGTRDVFVKKLL